MGLLFGSSNKTRTTVSNTDNSIAQSDGSQATQIHLNVGKKGRLEYTPVTNITQTDSGAVSAAAGILGDIIAAQSGLTSASLALVERSTGDNARLAETKITDGANLNQKTTIVALAVLGGLAVVFIVLGRR